MVATLPRPSDCASISISTLPLLWNMVDYVRRKTTKMKVVYEGERCDITVLIGPMDMRVVHRVLATAPPHPPKRTRKTGFKSDGAIDGEK